MMSKELKTRICYHCDRDITGKEWVDAAGKKHSAAPKPENMAWCGKDCYARYMKTLAPSPAKLRDEIDALAKESRTVGYRSQGLATRKPTRTAVKDAVNHFAESLKRLSGQNETRDEFMDRQLHEGHDRYELENKDDPVKRLSGKGYERSGPDHPTVTDGKGVVLIEGDTIQSPPGITPDVSTRKQVREAISHRFFATDKNLLEEAVSEILVITALPAPELKGITLDIKKLRNKIADIPVKDNDAVVDYAKRVLRLIDRLPAPEPHIEDLGGGEYVVHPKKRGLSILCPTPALEPKGLMVEEWRIIPIEALDGFYEASNTGRIRSWKMRNGKRAASPTILTGAKRQGRFNLNADQYTRNTLTKAAWGDISLSVPLTPEPKGLTVEEVMDMYLEAAIEVREYEKGDFKARFLDQSHAAIFKAKIKSRLSQTEEKE